MSIGMFLSIGYFVIGLFFSYYWFKNDYEEEYNKINDDEDEAVEKGMAGMLLLLMVVFWLPILIYKRIKAL
jgi:hypothetical protein